MKTVRRFHIPPEMNNQNTSFLMQPTQNIWVTEFTEGAAIAFHEQLLDAFDQNPYRPIVIHINSAGGDVDALTSMLDTMDAVRTLGPSPEFCLVTVAQGRAYSAGALLLSYGDIRFATPKAKIMLHQCVSGTYGSQGDNEVEFRETSRINADLLKILQVRCNNKQSPEEFKKRLDRNLYLSADEAFVFGLIDAVGYPKVVDVTVHDLLNLNLADKLADEDLVKKSEQILAEPVENIVVFEKSKKKAKTDAKSDRRANKKAAKTKG